MFHAILRIGLVTLAVVLVIVGLITMARVAGRQVGQVPPHPWFEKPTWDVRAPAAEALCAHGSPAATDAIYLLPVRKSAAHWQVSCAAAPTLENFLAESNHRDWLFEIEAGAGEDLDNFVDIVNGVAGLRVGVLAHSQRAARSLRKKMPGWVFAADDASLLRLHMFTSLYLESVFDFWPDFVIADGGGRSHGARELQPREVVEVQRRRKRVLWDAGENDAHPPYAVDGIVRRTAF